MTSTPSPIPGEIGRYQVERVLGRGAMGTVYLASDPHIQRRVALKTIRADLSQSATAERDGISEGEWSARFINEARAAGRLVHPNIVAVFDYGETDGVAYIALEYVDGGSLADRLARHAGPGGTMPLRDALTWFAQLLDALAYAHERGVIHRDIKPANLLMGTRGECKIADFGIAQIDTGRLTAVGMMIGTPSYMSPEQYIGREVDARSDLFSAGVVLYEMVTGRCPFVGTAAAIMHQVLETMPPAASSIVSGLPVALDAMLARALAKRPEDRYASADAWRTAVLELIDAWSNRGEDDRTVVAPLVVRAIHTDASARTPSGIGVSATAGRFSKAMLADIERVLASHVGPVASLLVKRAVARSTDARTLAEQLARHAPDDAARRDIDAALAGYAQSARVAQGRQPSGVERADVHAAGVDASPADLHHPAAGEEGVDNTLLDAAARCLAVHIGPVATLVARRASRGADIETFFSRLADALPASVDKVAFIERLREWMR